MSAIKPGVRIVLFVGTISPMVLLLAYQLHEDHLRWAIVLAVVSVMSFFVPLVLLKTISKELKPPFISLEEVKLVTPNLGAFLLAYLLPIFALTSASEVKVIYVLAFVIFVGVLYTRANLIHVQPVYWIFKWQVYECRLETGEWIWVLAKTHLKPGERKLVNLGGHVHVEFIKRSK